MRYYFHRLAKIEFAEAVAFYEKERDGLGVEFIDEVELAINRILTFPNAWSRFGEKFRRVLTHKFPFGVVYLQKENKDIVIVAIMHLRRKPDLLENRL